MHGYKGVAVDIFPSRMKRQSDGNVAYVVFYLGTDGTVADFELLYQ